MNNPCCFDSPDQHLVPATRFFDRAEVCSLQDCIRPFEPGKVFDALLVSIWSKSGNPAMWSWSSEGKITKNE